MGCFGVNLVRFRIKQARKLMRRCGLQQRKIDLASSGTSLDCWIPLAKDQGRGSLLLLHGLVFNALLEWENQLPAFAEKFNLYVPNLLFVGESTTESEERSEVFQAECMKQMLDELEVSDRVHVLGTSYGGFVAFWMAHLHPDRIGKAVFCSSGIVMNPSDTQGMLERFGGGASHPADLLMPTTVVGARRTIEFATQKKLVLVPDCLVEDILEEVFCFKRDSRLEVLNGTAIGSAETAPSIPQLEQDVLIVWGENDQVFDVELAHRLKRHLGNPGLQVIRGAAHAPQVDDPKTFNQIVLNFLCT